MGIDTINRRSIVASLVLAPALIAAACSDSSSSRPTVSPSAPSLAPATSAASRLVTMAVGDSTTSTPEAGKVKVCKLGNVNGIFTVTGTGTLTVIPSPTTVTTNTCIVVAEDPITSDTTGGNVTITETSAGLQSVSAVGLSGPVPFANGGSLFVNSFHGYTVTFTNNVVVTGNNGCTPGFWKQPQHFDTWPAGVTQTTSFNAAFGIGSNWFPNTFTLLDALSNGGGGVNALGRQAAAALLNAGKGFYPLSTAQVIADVQAAYADASIVESTKNLLEADNILGCPLN
jgi:hypothetical protein